MLEEEIELIDYLRVIWKRRRLIVGGTLACMLAALVVALLLPKVYQATLDLKVGQIGQQAGGSLDLKVGQIGQQAGGSVEFLVENPYRVTEVINSEPFLELVRQRTGLTKTAYEMKKDKMVVAKAIEGGGRQSGDRPPILVNVVAKAYTPEKAVELANTVAELVIQDHTPRFDALMQEHHRYEGELEGRIQVIEREIDELDKSVKRLRTNPQVNAPAVILLQAQLEQKQVQVVSLIRELRDVKMGNATSENTLVTYPPVLPEDHVNPKTGLTVLIAGIMSLVTVLLLAFFLEYLEQVRLREKASPGLQPREMKQ